MIPTTQPTRPRSGMGAPGVPCDASGVVIWECPATLRHRRRAFMINPQRRSVSPVAHRTRDQAPNTTPPHRLAHSAQIAPQYSWQITEIVT